MCGEEVEHEAHTYIIYIYSHICIQRSRTDILLNTEGGGKRKSLKIQNKVINVESGSLKQSQCAGGISYIIYPWCCQDLLAALLAGDGSQPLAPQAVLKGVPAMQRDTHLSHAQHAGTPPCVSSFHRTCISSFTLQTGWLHWRRNR